MFSWPGFRFRGLQIRLAQSGPRTEPPGRDAAALSQPVSLLLPMAQRLPLPDWLWGQRRTSSPLWTPRSSLQDQQSERDL